METTGTRLYLLISGGIFGVVALLHLLRLIAAWPVQLGPWSVPMWVSWVGLVVPAILCIWAIRLATR